MPRGRKRSLKLKLKSDTVKSIIGVFLLFFSALSFVAFILPDYTINGAISSFYRKFFGYGAYITPFVFLMIGLLLIGFRWRMLQARVFIGYFLVVFSFPGLLHVFYSGDNAVLMALKGYGGGIIGYRVSQVLSSAISSYGAFFILSAAFLTGCLLVSDISTQRVLDFIRLIGDKVHSISLPKLSLPNLTFLQTKKHGVVSEDESTTYTMPGPIQSSESDIEVVPPPSEPVVSSAEAEPRIKEMLEEDSGTLTSLASTSFHDKPPEHKLPYSNKVWECPPKELLTDAPEVSFDEKEIKRRQKTIEDTLRSFGISVKEAGYNVGPTVTQYAYSVPPGTRISKISNLQVDLAMALESPTGSVRLEIPIPGRNAMGVEVPNSVKTFVYFKDVLLSDQMKNLKSKLGVGLGKDVGGMPRVYDIGKMPHLLVAGATGSGKSVFLHSIMFSILYRASPQEVKFILIDPKRVELVNYNGIPHLLTPVITDMERAPSAFRWAASEMSRRYKLFEAARARNIDSYNEKSGFQALPHIVIIVDELADIMIVDPTSVEKSIVRLSQLSRATGIHMVLTVQRPSTDVLTGLIKANIPARVAFNVTSQVDSRVIIDQAGAEKLIGRGDMLFVPPDASKPIRIQGAYIGDGEISKLVDWLKGTGFIPEYKEDVLDTPDDDKKSFSTSDGKDLDELYDKAVEAVVSAGKASVSFLQRRLSIGYARAARIMDQLEETKVVSTPDSNKERQVLTSAYKGNDPLDFIDNKLDQ